MAAAAQSRLPIIAVVAMAGSVHAARWLGALREAPFRFVLLPAVRNQAPVQEFGDLVAVATRADAQAMPQGAIGLWSGELWGEADALPPPITAADRSMLVCAGGIASAIEVLQPALVHSMELQHAGYGCYAAARRMGARFPPWLVSNWGSDIQLYSKLPAHRPVLEAIASRIDGYIGECARDAALVSELGYAGHCLETIPASCGACFAAMPALHDLAPASARRDILVKGYHGWSGRALHALSAIHLAASALKDFRIRITLGNPAVAAMAEMIRARDRLDIAVEAYAPSHADALTRLAAARATVGIGISDGIGTTTLEAMALGCFPIVGSSSCAGEWLRPDRDGIIVSPHDTAALARALQTAATDDALVDAAAVRNRQYVERHWDAKRNAVAAIVLYAKLLETTRRE
jgi:hypothetical protein